MVHSSLKNITSNEVVICKIVEQPPSICPKRVNRMLRDVFLLIGGRDVQPRLPLHHQGNFEAARETRLAGRRPSRAFGGLDLLSYAIRLELRQERANPAGVMIQKIID